LKDLAKSLPRETLLAVVAGYAIYLAIPIFLSQVVDDRQALLGDSLIVARVARWPESRRPSFAVGLTIQIRSAFPDYAAYRRHGHASCSSARL
jgi:hypothetical protein